MATFIKKLYACKINNEKKKWKCKIFINYGSIFSKACAALKSNAAQDEANLITLEASQRGGWVSCRALSDASKYMTHTHSWNTHTYTYTWHTHILGAVTLFSCGCVVNFIHYLWLTSKTHRHSAPTFTPGALTLLALSLSLPLSCCLFLSRSLCCLHF